ncbi:MAG: DUF951 domain-containing protein [Clostridia bacterium]|nr:DUF951 domain-containing protein [Clostridia bacterium]
MNIVRFSLGDLLKLKKPHPCGSDTFRVMRVGSDVRIACTGCSRDLTLPRIKLEGQIKKVIADGDDER